MTEHERIAAVLDMPVYFCERTEPDLDAPIDVKRTVQVDLSTMRGSVMRTRSSV